MQKGSSTVASKKRFIKQMSKTYKIQLDEIYLYQGSSQMDQDEN